MIYVVSLMLKSGFKKIIIIFQSPQLTVTIINFPEIKLLKLKNWPFEYVQVFTHLYSYQEPLTSFLGLRHGYFADQSIQEEFLCPAKMVAPLSLCAHPQYTILKNRKKKIEKTKCEKKVQNIIFQAGLGIIDCFVLPCRNINYMESKLFTPAQLWASTGSYRNPTFTVCTHQGTRWQMLIDANTFTGSLCFLTLPFIRVRSPAPNITISQGKLKFRHQVVLYK